MSLKRFSQTYSLQLFLVFKILYCFLSFRFSIFPIFILFAKNGSSLCFFCISFGYSASTSKIYLCLFFVFFFTSWSAGKIVDFLLPRKAACWQFLDHCPSIKVFWVQILKICACLIKILLLCYIPVGVCIAFYCLSNFARDNTFFKYQQHFYASKQLKPKLVYA